MLPQHVTSSMRGREETHGYSASHPRRVPNFTVASITRERNAQNEKLTDCVMGRVHIVV